MGRWPFRCSAVCALGIPEVRTELTSTVLEMLLETEHGSAARLSGTGVALPARSKTVFAFNDVSNLARFSQILFAFGMPTARNAFLSALTPQFGWSGRTTLTIRVDFHAALATTVIALYLEQYIDQAVTLQPNKQITRIWQWIRIELKVRQSRPRER
jgi:hypothetical protein